jgi:hypothetical protein
VARQLLGDAAHARGSALDGHHARSYTAAATFSLFPKVVPTAEGGNHLPTGATPPTAEFVRRRREITAISDSAFYSVSGVVIVSRSIESNFYKHILLPDGIDVGAFSISMAVIAVSR